MRSEDAQDGAPPASSGSGRPKPLVDIALGAAWLLGLAAVVELINVLLSRSAVGAALAGALVIDLAAGYAGVKWSQPDDANPRAQARRLALGVGLAAAIVLLVVALGLVTGQATIRLGHPTLTTLLDVVRAAAVGVRDELLHHGIPLFFAARAGLPALPARAFAALAGAAAIALLPATGPGAIALALGAGWLLATLWQRERGAWMAIGAHAGLVLLGGAATHGGLLDVDWARGNLAFAPSASSIPAYLTALVALAAAFALPRLPGFRDRSTPNA